jgi:exosortase/archaeosortase family protein
MAIVVVAIGFPKTLSRKGILFILLGYLGTIGVNILRIFLISLSGYLYGPSGVLQSAHINIGWMIFTRWMVVFWFFFFTRVLGITRDSLRER